MLEALDVASQLELLVNQFGQIALHVVWQEFIRLHGVSVPLGRRSPQVLLVARQHDLHEVRVMQTAFASGVEEFDEVATAHVTYFLVSIVSAHRR